MNKYFTILLIFTSSIIRCQTTVEYNMKMWTTYSATMWDDSVVTTWGFSEGSNYQALPSPTLYANEGDTIIVNIRNQSQPYHHSIHWHGLDVDQANDGVPQTSFKLSHMEDSSYTFIAPHAGTYLYHCHVASIVHVQMGMYGNVIVRPKNGAKTIYTDGPSYDREYNWLMSEIDKSWHDSVPMHHDITADSVFSEFSVPEYQPNYFLINGKSKQQIKEDSITRIYSGLDEKVLIRLSNIGYFYNQVIFPSEANANIIMSDGRVLPNSIFSDTLILTPGERYSVLLSFNTSFKDSIKVNYINMNLPDNIVASEFVPLDVVLNPGIKSQLIDDINVYPIPSSSTIFITGVTKKTTIKIINQLGEIILSTSIIPSDNEIDLSNFTAGIYYVSAETDSFIKTIKIIKK